MRRAIFALFVLHGLCSLALGKLSPLTVKDVSLMLRSGYAVAAIEKDLAARHFLGPIDALGEKQLTQAGATGALITDLKSTRYAVPAEEVLAAQQEMEARALRSAAIAEEAKKTDKAYLEQVARSRAEASVPVVSGNIVASTVKGDLVTSQNGTLHAYDDQALERKKLICLYFSAKWCGPCRKFTPDLVAYYNRVVAVHPEFEIVFVSNDRSAPAMEAYMREMQMPWPAVKFEKIAAHEDLQQYAGNGIPCLVVIDARGKVVSHSYDGENYRGPQAVLGDLDKIFASNAPAAVAQTR